METIFRDPIEVTLKCNLKKQQTYASLYLVQRKHFRVMIQKKIDASTIVGILEYVFREDIDGIK